MAVFLTSQDFGRPPPPQPPQLKALFLKGSWVGCRQMYAFVIFPFWQCYQLSSICHSSISSGAKTVASIWPKKMWTSETVQLYICDMYCEKSAIHTNTPLKFNSSPLKSDLPNRKVVFQPPFFRGELLNFGEIHT